MDLMSTIPHIFLDFMQMQEFAKDPLVFVGGEGTRLTDISGRQYIDGLSGVFVASLGHGDMPVIEAMAAQARELAFAPPLHGTNLPALRLTELLLRIAPDGVEAVKLVSGGSEATEAALKLARQYHQQTGHPRKFKVIGR